MYFIKESQRKNPKVSFILLDWSVRESFHILHYMKNQECDRDDFEIIIIEYYSREYEGIRQYEDQVDSWVVMEMPENCYYHKHLMYNTGIVISKGEIISICDSDAMVKPTYVAKIIKSFDIDKDIVFHIDQFRNNKKEYYPFNYPTFEQVLGEGCINYVNGKTYGVVDVSDPIHTRNYGACMCARKEDLINIGGADEHIDYVGHICGPYDMTFRLFNKGKREIWSQEEFMYHTWHPGSAGEDNYLGPHDGRHMSTTSLSSLVDKRIYPLVENKAIKMLRESNDCSLDILMENIIDHKRAKNWSREILNKKGYGIYETDKKHLIETYLGVRIFQNGEIITIEKVEYDENKHRENNLTFESLEQAYIKIKSLLTWSNRIKIYTYKILTKFLYVSRLFLNVTKKPEKLFRLNYLLKAPGKVVRDANARNIFSSSIIDLIIYLNRYETHINESSHKVILLDKIDEVILKLFIKTGALPKIITARISNSHDLVKVLEDSKNNLETILVPTSIYIRFYMMFYDKMNNELKII